MTYEEERESLLSEAGYKDQFKDDTRLIPESDCLQLLYLVENNCIKQERERILAILENSKISDEFKMGYAVTWNNCIRQVRNIVIWIN